MLPEDLLYEIIGLLPVESLVAFSRTCLQLHAIVVKSVQYNDYLQIPPRKRDAILQAAINDLQKQYLLKYALLRCPPHYEQICLFAGEHCSLGECAPLQKFSVCKDTLEHALAKYARLDDIRDLCGEEAPYPSRNAIRGLIDGRQYAILEKYKHLLGVEEYSMLVRRGAPLAKEWLISDYHNPCYIRGTVALGVRPRTDLYGWDLVTSLDEAAATLHNDLFVEFLEMATRWREGHGNLICLATTCIKTPNDFCLRELVRFFDRFAQCREKFWSHLWYTYARLDADPALAEHKARLITGTYSDYPLAAAGAASGGHKESMLCFLRKTAQINRDTIQHAMLSAAWSSNFDTMCTLQKFYGHLLPGEAYVPLLCAYQSDHEWVLDWCMDCIGDEPAAQKILRLEWLPCTKGQFLDQMTSKLYTLRRMVERGVANAERILAILTERQHADHAQLFKAMLY